MAKTDAQDPGLDEDNLNDEGLEIARILWHMRSSVNRDIARLTGFLEQIDERIERLNYPWEDAALTYENVKDGVIPYDLAMQTIERRKAGKKERNVDVLLRIVKEHQPVSLKEIRKHLEAMDHRLAHAANPAKAISNEMANLELNGSVERDSQKNFKVSNLETSNIGAQINGY